AKKWKEADQETTVKILKVANRESEGWLRVEDAKNFSCQDLGTIDKLWVKYSNGRFGFSVQKQIYQGMGGSKEFNWDDYEKLGDKVGWRKGGRWLNYSELTFSEKHYRGHLPENVRGLFRIYGVYRPFFSFRWYSGYFELVMRPFFSRVETCKL
ncbi:MAG: GUN4 domain-containing protein, partial [Trichodesmium sp. St19_bin1]|nr:GUN4 domain-containing protein [Trichodesmium sp. St19_bin1]